MAENRRFALRRGTAAQWTETNPILADGEEGYETDSKKRKVGDGTSAWTALSYLPTGTTSVDGLTDASTTGKAVVKAADAAAARAAIGAGTASTKADVGLNNVNNTADANKPISSATQTALDGKASTQQLTDGLAGKANSSHTHGIADITATGTKDSTTYLRGDGTWSTPPTSGGGATPADSSVTTPKIVDGAVTTPKLADGGVATAKVADDAITTAKVSPGVRTSLGKADTALQSAPVTQVAGKTGAVSLVKGDVGLGNVDNTADTAKPVSTAQQTALNNKANSSHTHAIADLTATGTKDNTTFLRGDGTWAVPAGSGGGGNDPRVKVSAVTLGDGSAAGPYTVQHNFGTRAVLASLRQKLFPFKEIRLVDIAHPSINALQIITDKPLPQVEIDLLGIMGTTDVTPPSTATASLVSKTDTSVTLSATATDDVNVTAYNWFRGGSFVGTSLGTANYVSSGLTPSTQYSFTATAVDSSGNESAAQSTAVVVTTNAPTTPPTFDPATGNSSNGGQTFNYTVPAGSNRTVYVAVSHINSGATQSSASVTCGGTAMTNVGYAQSNGQAWVGVYKLDGRAPGTYVITTSTQENYCTALAFSYVPVSATTVQTSTGGGSTTPASTSVAVAQNEALVTVYSCRESPTVVTGTQRASYNHSSGFQFVRVLEGTGASPQSTSMSMANAAWCCVTFKATS